MSIIDCASAHAKIQGKMNMPFINVTLYGFEECLCDSCIKAGVNAGDDEDCLDDFCFYLHTDILIDEYLLIGK